MLSLLLAAVTCLGTFAGFGTTAFAAGERMTAYMVDLPRSADPNKTGWGHPALSLMGGWSVESGDHYTVHTQDSYNGKLVYCIEPGVGVHTSDSYTGFGEDFWDNYPSSLNPTISPTVIKAYIGRIMQYGWQGNASTSWDSRNPSHANEISAYIATQLLVWETVVGERDSQFEHVWGSSQGKNNMIEYISDAHPLRSQIFSHYASIEAQVKRHTMLPSFFSRSAGAADTFELKWNGTDYSVSLTDSNDVFSHYTFSSSTAGMRFSVDGNTLTIRCDTAPKGSVTITQDFATFGATVSDPVSGLLKLEVMTGSMKLVKTSEDGKVEGIRFTITGEGYSATKTTNAHGEIDITDLNPGVYTVTEQAVDKYEPQATQRVTIVSGQTSTVNFNNVLKRGDLQVTKTSEDGLVEGMKFHLYGTSLSGLPVDEYAVTDAGAEFQVFLKSAGNYEGAKDSERDVLTCDENGFAQTKAMPYGIYTVHQTKGWEGRELIPDFDVYIAKDGQVYRYLINNAAFRSYIKIVKVDAETGKTIPYAGAGFQLYRPDGSLITQTFTYPTPTAIDTFYTNDDGCLVTPEKLEYGTGYSMIEVQAPYGYVLNTEPVYFDVT